MVLVNLSLSSVRDRGSELRWFNWLCRTLTGSSPPKQCNLIWIFHQVQMGLLPTWSEDVLLSKVTWTTRGRSFSSRCESRVAWKNHLLSLLVLSNQKYVLICIILKFKVTGGSTDKTTHTRTHTQSLAAPLPVCQRESFPRLHNFWWPFKYCKWSWGNDELLCSCSKQVSASLLHESYFDVSEVSHPWYLHQPFSLNVAAGKNLRVLPESLDGEEEIKEVTVGIIVF